MAGSGSTEETMRTRQSTPANPETPSPEGLLAAAREIGVQRAAARTWLAALDAASQRLVAATRDEWRQTGGVQSGIPAAHVARSIVSHLTSNGQPVPSTKTVTAWLLEKPS